MSSRTSSNNGTPGWWVKFLTALMEQAPRPGEIDQDTALGWCQNQKGLKKVLAEALIPKARRKIHKVIVDYSKDLENMIEACNCVYNSPDINDENFKINGFGKQAADLVLVSGREVLTWLIAQGQAAANQDWVIKKQVLAFMASHGLIKAAIQYLLSFGAANPDLQREFPIVALGSVFVRGPDDRLYPFLYCNGDRRELDLDWADHESQWSVNNRFLAVRKAA